VSSPNILRRSDNGGDSWTPKVSGIDPSDPKNFYPPLVMDSANSDHLLLGTNRAYETTDAADSWSPISTPGADGWTTSDRIDALAIAPSDSTTVYASAAGHIFVTTSGGTTWQQRDIPVATDHFAALVVDPTDSQSAYAVRDRLGGGHVFRTGDGGQSWTDISGDLPDLPAHALALDPRVTPNTLYLGTDNGVYGSGDGGSQWAPVGAGLPNALVSQLQLSTDLGLLAVGTHGRGVWEITIPGCGGGCTSVPPGPATLVSPAGATSNPVTYTWNAVADSTWYQLWVDGPSGNVIQQWYQASDAGCGAGTGTCSVTPDVTLAQGDHTWWIQTWNDAGEGPWSDPLGFLIG
jgi:photosystem II stability/assembly factor-like uncharacterized protein